MVIGLLLSSVLVALIVNNYDRHNTNNNNNSPGISSESKQPHVIRCLRRDLARLRNAIVRDKTMYDLDPDIVQLVRRLDETNIIAGATTHTKNKSKIIICTAPDPAYSSSENYDTLVFVTLHEIAHVMTPEWGHASNFWENFDVIITIARRVGIFHGLVDFAKQDFRHCAHVIKANYLPTNERNHPARHGGMLKNTNTI